ncbi:hypothetical protein M2262_003855 [Pseudomonas sp. BIGb0408]|uniref:Uncharacterized protein n=1 Tax=Phytopseudomonas flavescens TaxID=29435 RepID=A0A7Y9XHS6_9GAMM|nr:hypothetical protein [Pseudomonas sp. BIGb0408]NYH71625.1 hypothetical protein [Pseudomonas flavescens]
MTPPAYDAGRNLRPAGWIKLEQIVNKPLKNVGEAASARQKPARKRSVLWYMSIPSLF